MSTLARNVTDPAPLDRSFGTLLAETLLEMESAELMDLVPEDAVQRLSLEAQQAVVGQTGRPLPRVGGYSYRVATVSPPAQTHSQLDVRY